MSNLKPEIFKFKREGNMLLISCEIEGGGKYALANQQGVILIKGDFDTNHKISIEELKPGYYTLTLLNAEAIKHFSVTI